jgi:ElaB/YqjD/DUF883 family membrane-anchored ribosome-binding protein
MTRTKSVPDDVAKIDGLIGDLEKRLLRLKNGGPTTAASGDANDLVGAAFARIMSRVRSNQAADNAFKAGEDAFEIIDDQIERSPLTTLAIAAGIGFLLGSAPRP